MLKGLTAESLGAATSKLYYAVQNVFSPMLSSASEVSSIASNTAILQKVQTFLKDIKLNFSETFGCDIGIADVLDKSQLEFLSQHAIQNEIIHWSRVKNKLNTFEDKSAVAAEEEAVDILQQMRSSVEKCSAGQQESENGENKPPLYDLELIGDTIETFYDSLDALWRIKKTSENDGWLYSKERMENFLFSLTCFMCATASNRLVTEEIWNVSFLEIESNLERASRMLSKWEKVVVDLCKFQWKEDSRSFSQTDIIEVSLYFFSFSFSATAIRVA